MPLGYPNLQVQGVIFKLWRVEGTNTRVSRSPRRTRNKKVKIVMGALGGDARREISVLAEGDRDKASKIFEYLDVVCW